MTVALPPVDPILVEEAAALSSEEAATLHATLAAEVTLANELYHAQDAPELTDAEYDQLFRRLVALARRPIQPSRLRTRRRGAVSGTPSGTFSEVRHRRPMLSLSNAFSHDELRHRRARPQGTRAAGGAGAGPGPSVRRGTQDRRPRHHAPLRARQRYQGRDPWQ